MKISVFLSCIIILTFLVSIAMAKDEEIENLMENSDFEAGTNGWSISADWGSLSMDTKADPPPDTDYPVMLATITGAGADAWQPEIHSPSFDVDAGEKYTVDFWARTEEAAVRDIGLKFEQLEQWGGPSTTLTITEEWQHFVYTPDMTVQSPPQVVIHIQFNGAMDDVWFSHFRVYEGEFVEEELGGLKKAVSPSGSMATAWGAIKSE